MPLCAASSQTLPRTSTAPAMPSAVGGVKYSGRPIEDAAHMRGPEIPRDRNHIEETRLAQADFFRISARYVRLCIEAERQGHADPGTLDLAAGELDIDRRRIEGRNFDKVEAELSCLADRPRGLLMAPAPLSQTRACTPSLFISSPFLLVSDFDKAPAFARMTALPVRLSATSCGYPRHHLSDVASVASGSHSSRRRLPQCYGRVPSPPRRLDSAVFLVGPPAMADCVYELAWQPPRTGGSLALDPGSKPRPADLSQSLVDRLAYGG